MYGVAGGKVSMHASQDFHVVHIAAVNEPSSDHMSGKMPESDYRSLFFLQSSLLDSISSEVRQLTGLPWDSQVQIRCRQEVRIASRKDSMHAYKYLSCGSCVSGQ